MQWSHRCDVVEKNNRTLHETFLSADRSCEEFENNSDPFGDWSGEATGPEGSGVSMSLSDVIYQGICLHWVCILGIYEKRLWQRVETLISTAAMAMAMTVLLLILMVTMFTVMKTKTRTATPAHMIVIVMKMKTTTTHMTKTEIVKFSSEKKLHWKKKENKLGK